MKMPKVSPAFLVHPTQRTEQDLDEIYDFLRSISTLHSISDQEVANMCGRVRHEYHDADEVLFCRDEPVTSWYILLSGATFIDGTMFLPYHCFGKRYGNADHEQLRATECLVLEPSEMIAVDYADVASSRTVTYSNIPSPYNPREPTRMAGDAYAQHHSPTRDSLAVQTRKNGQPRRRLLSDNSIQMGASTMDLSSSDRSSRGSDDTCSSGAFSGTHPAVSGGASSGVHSTTSDSLLSTSSAGMDSDVNDESEDDEEDVDHIEDLLADGEESISASSCTFRDTVREALEMPPNDRCLDKEAMDILLDFMQRLPAFAGFTQSVQRELCEKMQFVSLEEKDYVVLDDGEKLDSWAVIINGAVEVKYPDGTSAQLHAGDCYGILSPTMEALYHRGVMRTLTDDCQFACVAQEDYWEILSQGEEHTRKIENDTGQVVMVIEHRLLTGHTRRCPLVIKATPERLIAHLMEENSMNDPFYIEDFLLTYRTFLSSPTDITDCLMRWYADTTLRDRAIRIVLLWVNNHFIDFERYPAMIAFLEQFQYSLETHKKASQLHLLHIACAAKGRQRTITLTRSTREEHLNFSILGGWDRGFGVFICDVKKSTKAEELGLRRGDQILQVNGVRFEHVTHSKALDVLRTATHLSITVKSNLLGYREMLVTPADSPRHRHRHRMGAGGTPQHRLSSSDVLEKDLLPASVERESGRESVDGPKKHFMTLGSKARLKKALMKMNLLAKDIPGEYVEEGMPVLAAICTDPTGNSVFTSTSIPRPLQHSRSNPDLTAGFKQECLLPEPMSCNNIVQQDTGRSQYPDHVLKVYKGADQTCKYLLVHKETTAREVVMLALAEFGIHEPSQNFCLCQVSVEAQNVIKQRRLPDEIANLADSIPLNGRYYLKNNRLQETLVADDVAPDIWRESLISLLQLNTVELAAQLTLQDFAIFKQIEATDYIEELFNLRPDNNPDSALHKFENVVNREMFWVITEICAESNLVRRVKIVKHFIKIAKYLHEAKNINSCFAILSGLNHGCVARLKQTWDRVGGKYMKIFDGLSMLMDPSRNMNKYRQLLAKWAPTPPVIPFYPVVRKDLTFLHEGNDSHDGDLINFEKLRMISKEIRLLKQYTSSPYFLQEMIDGASGMMSLSGSAMSSGRKSHGSRSLPSRKKSNTIMNVSAKKLYEEAQMVRKVKQYWNNFQVLNDEDKLHSMSLTCEPSTAPIRRQHSVPEQVSAFAGPKFGQRSPQAVRRLLDLSDSTKVRHNTNHANRTRREQTRSSAVSPKPPYANSRRTAPIAHPNHGTENTGSFGFLRPPYATRPVDLTAESTSVIAIRKSQSGSVASTESSHSMTDSGLANSCSSSVQSSPSLMRGCTPPAPYPSLSSSSCSSTVSTMVRSVVSRPPTVISNLPLREVESFTSTTRHRPRAPPDYVAATMTRPVPPPYGSMAPPVVPPSISAMRKPYSGTPSTTKLSKNNGNGSMV